jgi:hypothetical protein
LSAAILGKPRASSTTTKFTRCRIDDGFEQVLCGSIERAALAQLLFLQLRVLVLPSLCIRCT